MSIRSTGAARPWEEAKQHAKARRQAVCDPQVDGLGGVAAGQGQQGRAGSGRAGSRGVRGRSCGQALQDLESDELGVLPPAPGQGVEIPKPHGPGVRMLGVPTMADRVAQTVVAMHLEERADRRFHPDCYGYRPGKSAHQALAACRQRCWKYDWVIDLDVQKFFDEVPWDLVVKTVTAVHDARWVLLYVKRGLAAPLEPPGRVLEQGTKGTPQGSAVSPI